MRILVLSYSYSGNTRKVAKLLAKALGADFGEIACRRYTGWRGPLAMAWDIFTRGRPPVDISVPTDAHYDLVIVGGPVWAARAAPPIVTFLAGHGREDRKYGLFVTCGGTSPKSPPEPAIAQMVALVPGQVTSTWIFREAEIQSETLGSIISAFAKSFGSSEQSEIKPKNVESENSTSGN